LLGLVNLAVTALWITEETAAFVIHSTASNILFLAEREKQLP
jgi:hypothetical protein